MPTFKKKIVVEETQTQPNEPRSNSIISFIVQFAVVAMVFLAIGFSLGQKSLEVKRKNFVPQISVSNKIPPEDQNIDFSLMWQVLEILPQKYLEKTAIDGQKLLYGAISGMVRSLGDPYTAFLDPRQSENIKSEIAGQYEGVGIQIGFNKDKRLTVIAPLSGTPAEKAGVLAKDLILKIGERDTFDLTLPEAVDLIRGPAGSKVKLTLNREKETRTFDVEIERAKIEVKSVEVEFKGGKNGEVAIIKVSRFGDKTDSEWDAAVAQAQERKVKRVIVDMRNNPGGLLSSGIHLASEFVNGTVVKQEYADGTIQSAGSDHQGKLTKIKLVVLVNGGSASAAEIFAGAIQDAGRGEILGEQTFGKGTVQDVVDLPSGAGLHVTIARWLTPKGKSIDKVGITPDLIVERSEKDIEEEKDPQLEKALEII